MSRATDWAEAYREQARTDLTAAEQLGGQPVSVLAMLLQMTFEKAAKAALLYGARVNANDVRTSHRAALSLMKILKDSPFLLERLTDRAPEHWRPVVTAVETLTNYHPDIAHTGPWLEYPWENASQTDVHWPEKNLTPSLRGLFNTRNEPLGRLPDVFRFAHLLCDNAPDVFGN